MSEKKLVSLPKVFHVSARRPDPTIAPANQSSIARDYKASNLITTESKPNAKGASAESIAMSIQPNNSIAKKQGVYIQLPSRSAQPCSSSSSSVLQNILQSTPVQMEALLGAATTPQKTISPSVSITSFRKIKPKEQDTASIDVPEIPLHIIVETQFIEKEMLSENCLRTILDHELEVRKKFKSGQLLPANLRGELRKAASGGRVISKPPKNENKSDVIILSDDDEINTNEAPRRENKTDSEDSLDVPKYVIQLDSSLASLLSDSPGTQLMLPSSLIGLNGNTAMVSFQESGTNNNILNQVTTSNASTLNTVANIQNAGQMPIISGIISQNQSQFHATNQQQTQMIQQTISPLIRSVTLDGGQGQTIKVPVIDGILSQSTMPFQIQTSGESMISEDYSISNSELPFISGVVSQAPSSLIEGSSAYTMENQTLPRLQPMPPLPAIKEVISQGKIYGPTSTISGSSQGNLQSNSSDTTTIGVQKQPQLFQQGKTKVPKIRLASNLFIKQVSKSDTQAITKSPQKSQEQPTFVIKNRPFDIREKRKFHDQIVQTMSIGEKESGWPQRNRGIQCNLNPTQDSTGKPLLFSVAIQCELIDSESRSTNFLESLETEVTESFDKEKFKFYENGKWECLICGEVGADPEIIAFHYRKHKQKSTLCFYCGQSFKHMKDRKYHELISHKKRRPSKKKLQICPHPSCDVIKYTVPDLYDHINFHTGEEPHKCSCGNYFYSYSMLQWHQIKSRCAKGMSNYPYPNLSKIDRSHEKHTRKLFKRGKVFMAKYKREKFPKNVCKLCFKEFKTFVGLGDHIRKAHRRNYMCKICRNYIPIRYRKDHMKAERLLAREFKKVSCR